MSHEHPDTDKIQFHVLDWITDEPYVTRVALAYAEVRDMQETKNYWDVLCELPTTCHTPEELLAFFLQCERENGEGICFRTPDAPYFQKSAIDNRSSLEEQWLVKLARFIYGEGHIVGFEEQMENGNVDRRNALGKLDRSSSQARQYGKNTLGVLLVFCPETNLTIRVGTGVGLTKRLRQHIWDNKNKYLGKQLTFKHKPFGMKDTLRSAIFVGWREKGF